jgi:hypothetical protein
VGTFFVKVGRNGVPAKIVNPQIGADWEKGQFTAPKAKRPNPSPRGKPKSIDAKSPPERGDGVFIWVNQNKKDGGSGLTAFDLWAIIFRAAASPIASIAARFKVHKPRRRGGGASKARC